MIRFKKAAFILGLWVPLISAGLTTGAFACSQKPIAVKSAASDGGYAWRIYGSYGTPADTDPQPTRSLLRIFENGRELQPAHSLHADIRSLGRGRFSHYSSTNGSGEAIRFSASDNSNVKKNRRSYTYCVGNPPPPPSIELTISQGTVLPPIGNTDVNISFVSGTPTKVEMARDDNAQFAVWPDGALSQYFTPTASGLSFSLCLECMNSGPHTIGIKAFYADGKTATASTNITIEEPPVPVGPGTVPLVSSVPLGTGAVYYVSPSGDDANPGTLALPWRTVGKAAATLTAGQTAYIRAGIYKEYVVIPNSGTASERISFVAYPGEKPVIDGSDRLPIQTNKWSSRSLLIRIQGSYVTLRGLEVRNAASVAIFVNGNYVVIDQVHAHNNFFAGAYFYLSSYGEVTNSIMHDSYDYAEGGTGGGQDSDCLASSASNTPTGVYGYHRFENNLLYNCSDDGIDTWTSQHNTIANNIVSNAGYSNASNGGSNSIGEPVGDGNGLKVGPGGGNIVKGNVTYNNRRSGYDDNSGTNILMINNTAFNSAINFRVYTAGNTLQNNLSYGGTIITAGNPVQNNNSWNLGITNPNFLSTNPDDPNFLRLAPGSPAIDAGVDVGLPYTGSAPDLGAYEN